MLPQKGCRRMRGPVTSISSAGSGPGAVATGYPAPAQQPRSGRGVVALHSARRYPRQRKGFLFQARSVIQQSRQDAAAWPPKEIFDSCASRAYFAVFHAEIAALIKLAAFRQDRWGHDRVQEEFNRQLVRSRKVFPASLQSIHNDPIGRRHIADYTAQHISARIAERCLRRATEMVTHIAGVLEAP